MEVVKISEYRNRDTVALLKVLLESAERGELCGVAICSMRSDGGQEASFSGSYRRNPAKGVAAAMRLSMRLAEFEELRQDSC